jgi:hypothetical protein
VFCKAELKYRPLGGIRGVFGRTACRVYRRVNEPWHVRPPCLMLSLRSFRLAPRALKYSILQHVQRVMKVHRVPFHVLNFLIFRGYYYLFIATSETLNRSDIFKIELALISLIFTEMASLGNSLRSVLAFVFDLRCAKSSLQEVQTPCYSFPSLLNKPSH